MIKTRDPETLLTMVIPTKDRSGFLERLLFYFYSVGFEHKIIIADSSKEDHRVHNAGTVQKVSSKLNILHISYDENIEPKEKIDNALSHVQSPYVVFGADDDFFVPKTLGSAVDFLNNNPYYSTVCGESLAFYLDTQTSHGKIKSLSEYPRTSIEDTDVQYRLIKHLSSYTPTWYSVHRTNQFMTYWDHLKTQNWDVRFFELLLSCLSIIDGKSKKLDSLYMVSQGNTRKSYVSLDSCLDWISDPEWERQYTIFSQTLCEYLILKANIDMNIAKNTVNRAFLLYISPILSDEYKNEIKKYWETPTNKFSLLVNLPIKTLFQHFVARSGLNILLNKIHIYKLNRKSPQVYSDLHPIIKAIECETNI